MTAQISAYGRLVADPQLKTTSKGTQMAMASMAVPLPCNQADDGTATMWLRGRDTVLIHNSEQSNYRGRHDKADHKQKTEGHLRHAAENSTGGAAAE